MEKSIVVAINSSKARFFTLEEAEWPEYESGPNLVERESLCHSQLNSGKRLWFTIDLKHHQKSREQKNHRGTFERKFAREIVGEIINLVRIYQGQKIIIIAQPQILFLIRKLFTPTIFNHLQIEELPKDISNFSCTQIHQYLAQKQFIPAYQKVFYPR